MPLPISTSLFISAAIAAAAWPTLAGEIVASTLAAVALGNESLRAWAARPPRERVSVATGPQSRRKTPIGGE